MSALTHSNPHSPSVQAAVRGERQWRRGVELARQGRHRAATVQFDAATRTCPGDSLYWLNLASSQHKCGQDQAAMASARRSFALDPGNAPACLMLGELLRGNGLHREALAALDQLADQAPRDGNWHLLRGSLLYDLGRHQDAMQALLDALAATGGDTNLRIKAMMQLGHCLAVLRKHYEAGQCYRTVLDLEPDSIGSALYAAHYSAWACDWPELDRDLTRLGSCIATISGRALDQRHVNGLSPFCLITLTDDPALMRWAGELACGRLSDPAGQDSGGSTGQAAPDRQVSRVTGQRRPRLQRPHGRLRIGLLSSDFHHHATTMLLVEALEHIDRSRYELYLYSAGIDDGSALRQRVAATATQLREVAGQGNEEIDARIRADQIGVLFDLKGFTMGSKMGVLARLPAPIQVAWLGYPGTSGADFIDYIVGDPVVTPIEHQPHFSEQIAQMPHCYQPNDSQRSCPPALGRAACGLPDEAFVFASFNQAYKIVPEVFAAWCRITTSRADAVLWLMVTDAPAQARLRAAAAGHGLAPERLIFAPFMQIDQHRARLPNVDLALDTFPCGGHTTASDALWAGVPVLALQGQGFASRVAASLLTTLGVPELVCHDLDSYMERAIALAGDTAALAALRQRVADARHSSPLFDGRRFARDLQALIERMVERELRGLAPAPLAATTTVTG